MPGDETARLAALARYCILDTEPERAFDDLTLLASQICGTPMALITLVDADRQWFKSRVGISVTETSRSIAFCAHAIKQNGVFTIADALSDERFRHNPMVTGEPRLRFYAGAPLVTPDGHALGTICVVDRVPRTLTHEQIEALQALKRQAEAQLELRAKLMQLTEALAARERAELERTQLIDQLEVQLSGVQRLTALVPYCSACQFNVVIPADPRSIGTITDGVTELLRERQWSAAEIMGVELAVQEAVANALRHGCGSDPSKQIQCILTCSETGDVTVVVRDPGAGFDTGRLADPLHPDNVLKTGGRGIFLINQLMDEVGFSDGGRELQMRKRRALADARQLDEELPGVSEGVSPT
jgi:anti-sigma regulatory factor (Ser/Thr protein kinase)